MSQSLRVYAQTWYRFSKIPVSDNHVFIGGWRYKVDDKFQFIKTKYMIKERLFYYTIEGDKNEYHAALVVRGFPNWVIKTGFRIRDLDKIPSYFYSEKFLKTCKKFKING